MAEEQAPQKKEEEKEDIIVAPTRDQVEAQKPKSLEDICIAVAKRFAGYPYVSVSCLKSYDDTTNDPKKISTLCRRLRVGYMMTGRGDKEEFVKHFVGQPIAYVQVHQECPTLCEDGCYNSIDIHGNVIKSFNVSEHIILSPETFKPFIIVKKLNEKGETEFGKIEGNPYFDISKDAAMAVLKMNQDPEAK